MSTSSWVLIDNQTKLYEDAFVAGGGEAGVRNRDVRVEKSTLRGGPQDGVDRFTVRTGDLTYIVLPTRGMNLWKAWRGATEYGWQSPVRGPIHPKFVPLNEPSGLGWLDGFDELLVRCGLESNGAPEFDEDGRLKYPLHGRIGNKSASRLAVTIDDDNGEVTVEGVVEEIRFHFFKLRMTSTIKTRVGSNEIVLSDIVENLSASPTTIQMLYHVNFGAPVLDGGAKFVAPLKEVVPRNEHAASGIDSWQNYGPPVPGFEEQVYFTTMHADANNRSKVLLRNAHGLQGATIDYRVDQLPCFSVWKNTTALEDGYVTGIEPGTNYPNPRSYETEQGRVGKLDGLGSQQFDVTLSLLANEKEVEAAETAIEEIRSGRPTATYDLPQPGWCADA